MHLDGLQARCSGYGGSHGRREKGWGRDWRWRMTTQGPRISETRGWAHLVVRRKRRGVLVGFLVRCGLAPHELTQAGGALGQWTKAHAKGRGEA